jgi:hypothetical protein
MVSKNYKTCSTQFFLHLLIALLVNFLHHPLPHNQTKTSVTFGCGYFIISLWGSGWYCKGGGPERRAFHNGWAPQTTRRGQPDAEEAGPSHRGKPDEAGPHPA